MKQANEELISKDKQKDEFLDTVAHELKTPVTGIRAATELLMDDDGMPVEIKGQFLNNMLNDSDRLSRLINNILDFEKLSRGRNQLNIQRNGIKRTIKHAIVGVQQLAINKGITIINDNLVDFRFSYDEDRILQVLTNLLSNALKFTEPNKGKIIVEYKMINNFVEVYVIDNGKAIPEEDFEHIFDKFYQSKNQNTVKPEGSGLGLAICKQILEQHNGKIWAKKGNKNGATFVFILPFK